MSLYDALPPPLVGTTPAATPIAASPKRSVAVVNPNVSKFTISSAPKLSNPVVAAAAGGGAVSGAASNTASSLGSAMMLGMGGLNKPLPRALQSAASKPKPAPKPQAAIKKAVAVAPTAVTDVHSSTPDHSKSPSIGSSKSGGGAGADQPFYLAGTTNANSVLSGGKQTITGLEAVMGSGITDEYNPAKPNDYEEFRVERDHRKRVHDEMARAEMEELERLDAMEAANLERNERMREAEAEAEAAEDDRRRGGDRSRDPSRERDSNAAAASAASAAAAAPPKQKLDLKMSAEDVFLRRQRMSGGGNSHNAVPPPPPPPQPQPPQVSSASDEPAHKRALRDRCVSSTPTRVILLHNLVGRGGGSDPELEGEIADECAKYGAVTKCTVYETKDSAVDDCDAVRIFVQFDSVEAAQKGVTGMGGRFFGGRTVRASFAEEERFAAGQFSP